LGRVLDPVHPGETLHAEPVPVDADAFKQGWPGTGVNAVDYIDLQGSARGQEQTDSMCGGSQASRLHLLYVESAAGCPAVWFKRDSMQARLKPSCPEGPPDAAVFGVVINACNLDLRYN